MLTPSQKGTSENSLKDERLIPVNSWGTEVEISQTLVNNNLHEIQTNIAHSKVKIVAVTKYYGLSAILAGYEAGIRDFGESRAVDAIAKLEKLPENVKIGDRVNIIDDEGGLYLSTRILKLEVSIAEKEQTATLGEYLIKGSGIARKVLDPAE